MSAKRFGGAHSPGGDPTGQPANAPKANKFSGRKASSVDVRTILMFVMPTPLLFGAIGTMGSGDAVRLVGFLAAYITMILGAWMLREGQKAEAAYDERSIARPPFPRKISAAVLVGIGVFISYWLANAPEGLGAAIGTYFQATIFGLVAIGAHVVAFGLDPLRSKGGTAAIHQAEAFRVAEALDKAEDKLKTIETLAHKLRDKEIDTRVVALNATVRDMISIVEKDPRDLSRARRYLGVYLKGALDATQKYADNHARLDDPKIRTDYLALLTDLEASFGRGRETLLIDDRSDLEVEIEVLRDRLGQEGA